MKILLATSAAVPWGGGIASYAWELQKVLCNDNKIYLLTDEDIEQVDGYESTVSNYGKDIYDNDYCKQILNYIQGENFDLVINS